MIMTMPAPPDGVEFDAAHISIAAIRAEDEYAGTRARLNARCGTARLTLQIDMGLGDAVWPEPQSCAYPALLEYPAPDILVYPHEARCRRETRSANNCRRYFHRREKGRHVAFSAPSAVTGKIDVHA